MSLQTDNDALNGSEVYMTIINNVPNIIYWVDVECRLHGYNEAYTQLVSTDAIKKFKTDPYQQMEIGAKWPSKRVEQLKLDDMSVMFSGEAQHNKEESCIKNNQGESWYYQSTRVPIYNGSKHIVGLVVVLTDVTAVRTLQLPLSQSEEKKVINKKGFARTPRQNPVILMIEDNLIAQHVEKALLTALHCQVDVAGSLDKAMTLFNPGKYDLVLMDIGLEDTSGYVVAKKLRQKEENTEHHVPIIALTGYDAHTIREDCEQYNMEGVIKKPLTSEQAEQIIKHYIYHQDVTIQGLEQVEQND